jgi:hypothetical protein
LAPIPGPFDEAAMLLVGGVLWLCYRDELREAWQRAAQIPNTPRIAARLGSAVSALGARFSGLERQLT